MHSSKKSCQRLCVCVTLSHHVEGACEIDTVHTSEGQRQVTPQQTTAHVLI